MSGLQEVDCGACGRHHQTSAEQARAQRVVRCACGQFVRLDRALVERRSEPAPALEPSVVDDHDDDEATHMLQSLSEVAALRGSASRVSRASLHGDERPSRPAPGTNTLRSLSPAPLKRPSTPPSDRPPSDKPLWYVDLGGTETVEMTIEQLIVARRSGKLGEGALVWREGMPRWRPVGTLIPATSVTARPTPTPPAPNRTPAPVRAPLPRVPTPPPTPLPRPSPVAQGMSYERPAATLEFALEKADSNPPQREPSHSPLPSKERISSSPTRSLTPVPRPDTWTASVVARAPTPLPPPTAPAASPVPQLAPPALTTPSAPVSFATDHPTQPPAAYPAMAALGQRPRWASACIAVLVCITASSAGAFVVRSLKLHRQPTLVESTLSQAPVSPLTPAHASAASPTVNGASNAPLVVDLQSLKVEPKRSRAWARPAPVIAPKPSTAPQADNGPAAADADDATPTPAAQKPKNSSLPAAAHSNPYTTGSDEPGL